MRQLHSFVSALAQHYKDVFLYFLVVFRTRYLTIWLWELEVVNNNICQEHIETTSREHATPDHACIPAKFTKWLTILKIVAFRIWIYCDETGNTNRYTSLITRFSRWWTTAEYVLARISIVLDGDTSLKPKFKRPE